MRMLTLFAALTLCSLQASQAVSNPALQESVTTAERLANLYDDQDGPYQLDVDFVAQVNAPVPGNLTLRWEAKDRWWRKIVFGHFQEVQIKNGEWEYTVRNFDFTPLRVEDLLDLLAFGGHANGWIAKKEKDRVENGSEMNCIQMEHPGTKERRHDVCLGEASKDIRGQQV